MSKNKNLPVQKCISGLDVHQLSDIELIAAVLGTGSKNSDVLGLASVLCRDFDGIRGLYAAGIRELASVAGMGFVKSVRLRAALELGRRIISPETQAQGAIDSPKKVWRLMLGDIAGLKQEEFTVLVLNSKNMLIKKKRVFMGTISEAIVHPREIYRDAIREAGTSIIMTHNHPSGNVTPSNEDINMTQRMVEAGEVVGIALIDHVIVGETKYLSFKEQGFL